MRMTHRRELDEALGSRSGVGNSSVKSSVQLAAEAEGGPPTISYAKAAHSSKKGEDFASIIVPGKGAPACTPAAFAVFDGHSGRETARICSEIVCQRLVAQGSPFTERQISELLWAVDEELGAKKVHRDRASHSASLR